MQESEDSETGRTMRGWCFTPRNALRNSSASGTAVLEVPTYCRCTNIHLDTFAKKQVFQHGRFLLVPRLFHPACNYQKPECPSLQPSSTRTADTRLEAYTLLIC